MFRTKDFAALYELLSADFLNEDCGLRCGKFCCVGDGQQDNAFKYLLPNEIHVFVANGLHHEAVLEDYGFVIHFRSTQPNTCVCQNKRAARPFCCRIFPFRPVIQNGMVVSLAKTTNPHFAPCWIETPLSQWYQRAVRAWQFVLNDIDNLIFFCRLFYCLEYSKFNDCSFSEAMQDRAFSSKYESFSRRSRIELLTYSKIFFESF